MILPYLASAVIAASSPCPANTIDYVVQDLYHGKRSIHMQGTYNDRHYVIFLYPPQDDRKQLEEWRDLKEGDKLCLPLGPFPVGPTDAGWNAPTNMTTRQPE